MRLVLLTGATGYIGGRLLRVLEEGGTAVRCFARHPQHVTPRRPSTEVAAGDCLDETSLDAAMQNVEQALYLVHSMSTGSRFAERDRQAAANFGRAARRAGVRRIIYLGGLGDDQDALSSHLKSRAETGAVLRDSGVPVIEFRASIVIGAGSLSFEMIRALVERLPAMVCPAWVATRTQPIAIDDVLAYLSAALDLRTDAGGIFEIGGPEVVSYGGMMQEYARQRGLRRLLVPVPVLTPRLSGLWLRLVTPAQAQVGRALVESLRNPTVVRSTAAAEAFPAVHPMPLQQAFARAMLEDAVAHLKRDSRMTIVDAPPAQAFAPVRRIGGDTGWYFGHTLWRLRSWIDRAVGGPGRPRSRRDPDDCVVGDRIDGWRVEAYEPHRLLRLSAGLKLPGRGWLEFRAEPIAGGARTILRQTATFDPRGIAGRLYWYSVLPLHALMFRGLIHRIAQRAVNHVAPVGTWRFTRRSIIDAPAADVFRWHGQPGALAALTPKRLVRIEQQDGGIGDGGRVTVSIGVGRARIRWVLRHHHYVADRRFCDEQVAGPFKRWQHAHLFEPLTPTQTLYEDRIEFAISGQSAANRLAGAILWPLLAIAFAHRHRVVRAALAARQPAARRWAAAIMLVAAVAASSQMLMAQAPVRTVPFVDLDRYVGDWFEVARFPNRFQNKCVGDVRASYARRPDGRIDVVNRCRTADADIVANGVARVVDDRTFARLEVRFAPSWLSWVPMVWGDYWIVGLAPDYSWAVVGDPGRDYLWILARTPQLDEDASAAARAIARDNGFDATRLVPTQNRLVSTRP